MTRNREPSLVVAIDGPAGAGKSTVARRLALALGLGYVDSGAMYRVIGVLAAERGIDFGDAAALAALCDEVDIRFEEREDGLHTLAGERDLSQAIRTAEAGQQASKVSVVPAVRERLVARQRALGAAGDLVMEGRDIGTVVFPDATLKVYLLASVEERARRRSQDLAMQQGRAPVVADVAREIAERDRRDEGREHSPLKPAPDAWIIDTTHESIDALVKRLKGEIAARRRARTDP
jgi:CMP/dCMP kinase